MEQHPVPQQISSYQFRLVGDMTLKQFFQLAGGGLVALLFYASPFPGFIKWPLIVFFVLFGAALAFLPIEERPLEVWIIAFFRSIYAPTMFYWKREKTPPAYFLPETATATASAPLPPQLQATTPVTPHSEPSARLEEAEKNFLSKLAGAFSLKPQAVAPAPVAAPPAEKKLVVPTQEAIAVQKPLVYQAPTPTVTAPQAVIPVATTATPVAQTLAQAPVAAASAPQFSADAAPPSIPTQANIIVGQVMDPTGKILEGAILEIKDTAGRPVRALRTNKAGHFLIVTPLSNGKYELTVEKPGWVFEQMEFDASGAIIPPMAIKAQKEEGVVA